LEYSKYFRNGTHFDLSQTVLEHGQDLGAIHSIINSSQVLHVSFNPGPSDPFPAILPMIGQMGSFDYPSASIDEPLECYLFALLPAKSMD
jgi:hypothetical protein